MFLGNNLAVILVQARLVLLMTLSHYPITTFCFTVIAVGLVFYDLNLFIESFLVTTNCIRVADRLG
jgi:hypothetical protein